MLTRRKLLFGVATGLVLAATAPAQAVEWVVLGSRTVNLGSDHDRIPVGLFAGLFSRIRLEVSGNGIFIQSLKVTFVNGETASLPVRFFIEEGGHTRDILLPGLIRGIAHIDLTYRRVPGGGRAKVTVVGKKLI